MVCRASVAKLMTLLAPNIHIIVASKTWLGRLVQSVDLRRTLNPDMAVCVLADTRVAYLMRMTGARQRVGFPMTERNYYASPVRWRRRNLFVGRTMEMLASMCGVQLLTNSLERKTYQQSYLSDWEQLANAVGLKGDVTIPWFETAGLPRSNEVSLLRHKFPNQKIWLLHPGARLHSKRWSMDRFEVLLRDYFASLPVIIIMPPNEPYPQPQSASHILFAPEDFKQLLGILAEVDQVICHDSLAAHLASALGKRVVSIFSSSHLIGFAPFANEDFIANRPKGSYKSIMDDSQVDEFLNLEVLTPADVAEKCFSL